MRKKYINGAPLPDKDNRCFWIETVPPGKKQRWIIYSPQVQGVWTHFHGLSLPCYKEHTLCQGGHDPATLRWQGYLFGYSYDLRRAAFLKVTEGAVRQLGERLNEGASLRGREVETERTAGRNGRQYLWLDSFAEKDPASLPPDIDVRPSFYNTMKLADPGHEWTKEPKWELIVPSYSLDVDKVLGHSGVPLASRTKRVVYSSTLKNGRLKTED